VTLAADAWPSALAGIVPFDRQESEDDVAGVMLLPRLKFRTS
jgi:hypothetical protein